MGNCQAVDTAAMVIQHPCGKENKFYSTVSAREVMKDNPGYHIALLITTTTTTASAATDGGADSGGHGHLRITRVKILRPADTLLLGRVYRLISHQEVVKGLTERRRSGMKERKGEMAKEEDEEKKKKKGVRVRGRGWRPSLGSIDEGIGL